MTLSSAADQLDLLGHRHTAIPSTPIDPAPAVARAQLDAVTSVVEDLAGQFELRPLLERILRHAAELLGCRSGSICTVDEAAGSYRKEVDLGVACRSGDQFPLTEGVTGEIVRRGGPVTFRKYADVHGGHIDPADRVDLHATIGVPIRWAGAVIGTCIVFSNDPARRFGPQDVTLLELFAGHAGLAIVNARMHAQAAELARTEATGVERERIVRDVHDSVSRALASVVLHLRSAEQPVLPVDAAVDGRRDHLELALTAARTALAEARRIVLGARSAALPAPTVEQAIQAQVSWARTTGLDIRLVVAGPPQVLPPEIADEVFGLAQQAISSIVEQADARTARVGLVYGADEVVLLVQDDGIGFDLDEIPRPDGSRSPLPPGIRRIGEIVDRAEHLGVTVQIDATPGWGTTIRAAIPYLPAAGDPPARRTVLLVEHRPVVRAGLLALLGPHAETVQVIGEIDGADGVVDAYRLLQPDVVVIDAGLPAGAAAITRSLREHDPGAAVVAIADDGAPNSRLRDVVRTGARAAVLLDADGTALARAIAAAARGEALLPDEVLHAVYDESVITTPSVTLTSRELQVRDLVSRGMPDKVIAEQLHISVKTVEKHVGSALRKTGARNRTELAGMTRR